MSDERPDTAPSPVHRPHERSGPRNEIVASASLNGEPEGKGTGWTMDARVSLAALLVTLLGAGIGGAVWIGGVAKDVAELQSWRSTHVADTEARIRAVEFTQHDSAGDMRVVSERLKDIDAKLANITNSLAAEPSMRRQPRNRPTPARPRVDEH